MLKLFSNIKADPFVITNTNKFDKQGCKHALIKGFKN